MNQTISADQYREMVRQDLFKDEHQDVRNLRLQRERIIHEQEKAKWEAAARMQADHLRKEIRALGHEPEA